MWATPFDCRPSSCARNSFVGATGLYTSRWLSRIRKTTDRWFAVIPARSSVCSNEYTRFGTSSVCTARDVNGPSGNGKPAKLMYERSEAEVVGDAATAGFAAAYAGSGCSAGTANGLGRLTSTASAAPAMVPAKLLLSAGPVVGRSNIPICGVRERTRAARGGVVAVERTTMKIQESAAEREHAHVESLRGRASCVSAPTNEPDAAQPAHDGALRQANRVTRRHNCGRQSRSAPAYGADDVRGTAKKPTKNPRKTTGEHRRFARRRKAKAAAAPQAQAAAAKAARRRRRRRQRHHPIRRRRRSTSRTPTSSKARRPCSRSRSYPTARDFL